MTPVEQAVWSSIVAGSGMPADTAPNHEQLSWYARRVAWHEAGHAAVLGAFGEASLYGLKRISILPEDLAAGFVECREIAGDSEPGRYRDHWFLSKVLYYLSGSMAGRRALGEPCGPDDVFCELGAELQAVGGAGGIMTDGAWAIWYAEKIVHRGWPRRRVLRTAFRWADDLLSIPEVWSAAEGVAARLLAQGVIRRRREIDRLLGGLDGVLERSPRHRTWRRRMPWIF